MRRGGIGSFLGLEGERCLLRERMLEQMAGAVMPIIGA